MPFARYLESIFDLMGAVSCAQNSVVHVAGVLGDKVERSEIYVCSFVSTGLPYRSRPGFGVWGLFAGGSELSSRSVMPWSAFLVR